MISVAEALARITASLPILPIEQVSVADAVGRVLATDVAARVTKPPTAVSAMDGYAVRAADVASVPAVLRVVGYVPAGQSYPRTVGPGEAVRLFTGAPVPVGADTIVIQENASAKGNAVTINEPAAPGRHIRRIGLDFRAGEVGLAAGHRLDSRAVALAAAMNLPWLPVRRRPRVAILSTGDEIVNPGDPLGPNQIVSSNALGLAAFVRERGGVAIDLGIAPDDVATLRQMAQGARGADLLVTTGGASVGEHDLVQRALGEAGMTLEFWKVAMRPGKPLMFGRIGDTPVLGLPGNPVSTLVGSLLFLGPALDAMAGLPALPPATVPVRLAAPLAANDSRQDYLRATWRRLADGTCEASPYPVQDSSMIRPLALADCLIVRIPHAPAAPAGSVLEAIPLRAARSA